MKKYIFYLAAAALSVSFGLTSTAWAEEDALAQEEAAAASVKDKPEWNQVLKDKFALTDEQLQTLKNKGLNYPQIAMVSQLAKSSGKTVDEVAAMRIDSKMGWGKIAKELGVAPKEIGHAVSDMRHSLHALNQEEKISRREEKRAERETKRQERMERKAEKKAEKAEHHGH